MLCELYVLVEDRDTAQRPAHPFRVVFGELGVYRFEERADEGDLERGSDNAALLRDVLVYPRLAIRPSEVACRGTHIGRRAPIRRRGSAEWSAG